MNTLCKAAKHMLEVADANQYAVANQAPHGDVMAYNAAVNNLRTALEQEEEASAWLAERKEHWRKEREKAQATKDQDPELSAALGWPGGISDPVLDRTRLLQMAAALRLASQQALEVLRRATPADSAQAREQLAALAALSTAVAQQAEPVQPGAWVAFKDGRLIYDYDFTHDVSLRVMGDFEDDEQRVRYAQRIVDKLNAAPPQRKLVPLTEEEIDALPWSGSPRQFARAVEKASWEKNNGKA